MLNHAPILIAEDEPLLAFELQVAVKDAEGEAVGPARSVVAALEILQLIIVAGAVLEVQLPDGDVTPVAKVFIARRVPMCFKATLICRRSCNPYVPMCPSLRGRFRRVCSLRDFRS